MPRHRKPTPSYLEHKQSGRARAVWTDTAGVRQYRMLPGAYDSPESRTAFARLQLELEAVPHHQPDPSEVSVNEVLLAFLQYAEGHYRHADGTTTNEYDEYKLVSRHVREVYGETPAAKFGPLALKAVRQKFIEAKWSRGFINQRVGRVRRIFKWAASEELVPAAVYQSLATVMGLQRGRTGARESEPVGPVDDATVDATLPFLNRHVRGLVEFQRLTGCRPGEACTVRRCDIDTGGAIWLYKPPHHKDRVAREESHDRHRSQIAGVVEAVFHPRPRRLSVLAGACGRRTARRVERTAEDASLPVAPGSQRGETEEESEAPAE